MTWAQVTHQLSLVPDAHGIGERRALSGWETLRGWAPRRRAAAR